MFNAEKRADWMAQFFLLLSLLFFLVFSSLALVFVVVIEENIVSQFSRTLKNDFNIKWGTRATNNGKCNNSQMVHSCRVCSLIRFFSLTSIRRQFDFIFVFSPAQLTLCACRLCLYVWKRPILGPRNIKNRIESFVWIGSGVWFARCA